MNARSPPNTAKERDPDGWGPMGAGSAIVLVWQRSRADPAVHKINASGRVRFQDVSRAGGRPDKPRPPGSLAERPLRMNCRSSGSIHLNELTDKDTYGSVGIQFAQLNKYAFALDFSSDGILPIGAIAWHRARRQWINRRRARARRQWTWSLPRARLEDGIDPLVLEAVRWKRPVKHDWRRFIQLPTRARA